MLVMNKYDEKYLLDFFEKYIGKDKRILDVGCGVGDNIMRLKKRGYDNVVGVDISSEMIVSAKSRGCEKVFLVDDLDDRDYDVLLFSHVLEHVPYHNIQEFLEFYFSLAKKEALVVILMPVLYDAFYNDIDHIKPYYPDGLMTLFSNSVVSRQYSSKYRLKLVDIRFRRVPLFPYNLRLRYRSDFIAKVFRFILYRVAVILRAATFGLLAKPTGYVAIFSLSE